MTTERRRRYAVVSAVSGLGFLVVSNLRLGVVDHQWPLALGLDLALLVAVPSLVLWARSRDAAGLAAAPSGTLYSGIANIPCRQFRVQPQLARFRSGERFRLLGSGLVVGTLRVTSTALQIEPTAFWGRGLRTVVLPWTEVRSLSLTSVPGKVDIAGVDLQLADGGVLGFEARGHGRLRAALAQAGVSLTA